MSKIFWTKERLEWMAQVALPRSTSVEDALRDGEKYFKRRLGTRNFYTAFKRFFGGKGPGELIPGAVVQRKTPTQAAAVQREILKNEVRRLQQELRVAQQEAGVVREVKRLVGRALAQEPAPPKWLQPRSQRLFHGTPTLMLSDVHHGEVVRTKELGGVNSYSMAISRKRLKRIFEKTIFLLDNVLANARYPGIVLALAGDILSGNIHEDIRRANEVPVFEALIDIVDILQAGIDLFLERFGKVYVPIVVGNHGRLDRRKTFKGGPQDNFEWMLGHVLAARYKNNEKVSFNVSDAFTARWKVHGTRYLMLHGDQFRGGTGISGPVLPWTLGEHRLRKQMDTIAQGTGLDARFDVLIFGHWHTCYFAPTYMANGSVKGFDEFTKDCNFPYEPPKQLLWITNPEYGVTLRTEVYGEHPPTRKQTSWIEVPK